MNSEEVLRRAARAVITYGRELTKDERSMAEKATAKVGEKIRLVDSGRMDLCGATPAELAKGILGVLSEKPCTCPTCRQRSILD